eukprot:SAG31_NODE_4988_length_2818_cov_9.534020_4_plen_116_part_00
MDKHCSGQHAASAVVFVTPLLDMATIAVRQLHGASNPFVVLLPQPAMLERRILHGVLTVGAHTTACSEYEGASSEDDEGSQEIDGPSNTKICVGGAVVVGNMVTRGLTGKKDHAN